MFESYPSEVNQMLVHTRAGGWDAYQEKLTQWTTNYRDEFVAWTQTLMIENESPLVSFTAQFTTIILGETVGFDSTLSADSDGYINGYHWDFGDGNSSVEANPVYQYSAAGNYQVTLTVTDDRGGVDSMTKTFTVNENQAPVASITAQSFTAPLGRAIMFDSAASVDSDGYISSYSWGFGDGNSSTAASPNYRYLSAGSYQVTLTVTDNLGATSTVTSTVTVTNTANNNQVKPSKSSGGSTSWVLLMLLMLCIYKRAR